MNAFRLTSRLLAYTWAAPNTALGVAAGLVVLGLGGRMRLVAGAAEFEGGLVGRGFGRLPGLTGVGAITLGHVILGSGECEMCALREHEHVHVRQYERWGPFFLPAYALSSVWQWVNGRRVYRDNAFERQAYAVGGDKGGRGPPLSASSRSASRSRAGTPPHSR